jgi:D-psicose/D-tagatose/L-ribulose 3-epimerase
MAAERGLEIALEPLNRFESDLINTTEDVMRLIQDIDHPAAKVMLDGFHMNIEEPDIERAIRLVGDKLIHVQVSENYRGTPGTGQTRWDAFYRGPLVPSQDGFASEGLQFLQKWAKGEDGKRPDPTKVLNQLEF